MAELTDEQVAREKEFLSGMPPLNVGALFLPPIWGPALGIWATILYYPIWIFADNVFYAAYTERTALSVVIAVLTGVILAAITFVFARLAQPFAAHRAEQRGVKKQDYVRREHIWAIVCVVVGCIMLAAAPYYNLAIHPALGE